MVGNLRRIMISIRRYYSEHLGLIIDKEKEPCLGLIARVGDQVQLERMMKLVLGCAVNGPERGKNIARILEMETMIRTELLTIINDMEMEKTLRKMRISCRKSKQDKKMLRQNSKDSGIVIDGEHTSNIEMVDFECQLDGYLESAFGEDEKMRKTQTRTVSTHTNKTTMEDFECQFDNQSNKTSDVIDVDECLFIIKKVDKSVNTDTVTKVDAQTDPVFDDLLEVEDLNKKVSDHEKLIFDKESALSALQNKLKEKEIKARTKAKRLMKTSKENEALKMTLRILTEEADNLRVDMKGKEELEKRFHELESSLSKLQCIHTKFYKFHIFRNSTR